MQSRLGLAHFTVFVVCGLISIAACCLGVFGVIIQGEKSVQRGQQILSSIQTGDEIEFASADVRQKIMHPKDKKWEPVFVLSQYDSQNTVE